MATGWTIEIGYNSHDSDKGALWGQLKMFAEELRRHPSLLNMEAYKFGAPNECEGGTRLEFCDVYARDWTDGGPCHIIEEQQCIHIMASGGGEARDMKEHIARAFCRIVIHAMHRKGIEVNLRVA